MSQVDASRHTIVGARNEVTRPLVSIVIPTFNAARVIERALASASAQTLAATEIIVVDDASTDRTTEVVRAWCGRGVRLLPQAVNRGPAAARNVGIRAAEGTYVAFLDADDEWMPEKLAHQTRVLEDNPRAAFCGCDAIWRFSDGSVQLTNTDYHPVVEGSDAWRTLLRYSFVQTPCVVARRDVLLGANCFDESLVVGEDQDLWIRLAMQGPVVWVHDPLVTVHSLLDGYMLSNSAREYDFLLPMIERHVSTRRADLTRAERRAILGDRFSQIGRNLYGAGKFTPGAKLIIRAIALGSRPFEHIAFLLHASPPGRWLKAQIRRTSGHRA